MAPIALMSPDRIRSLLPNRTLLYALAALAVVFGGWFFFFRGGTSSETLVVKRADFTEQVSVSGTVVATQDVDLGFSAAGRISHVYAKVGEEITEGTTIAEVENGDLRANLLQKQAALATEQAKLESLKNGTRPEEIAVVRAAVDNDVVTLAQADQAVVNAMQDAYAKSDDAIRNKVDQFFNNPRSGSPQLTFQVSDTQLALNLQAERAAIERTLIAWQSDTSSLLPSGDLSAEARTNLTAVLSFLIDASAALARGISSASVSQSTLSGYAADVATARTNVNAAQTTLTTAQTTRASARAALDKDQKTLALDLAGSTQADMDAEVARVESAQAEVQSAHAQLAKTIVVAPFSGIITKMDAKVGAIVSSNTSEISMISNGVFQIETYIPEVSVVNIKMGNEATVTLDAYGSSVPFEATVVSIDPAETIHDGVSTYKTKLQFKAADERIRSGMTATVMITTASTQNTIAVPKAAVYERGGQSFVQVQNGKHDEERPVRTGASSLGQVEITAGLSEGDTIILAPSIK